MSSHNTTRIYLFDAPALYYRAFHAIRGLTTHDGLPTNAVYGFVNSVRKLFDELKPTHAAFCFDAKGPTERHKKFEAYKQTRPPTPEALRVQVPWIKDIVRAMGFPVLEWEGYEADDVIASLAKRLAADNHSVIIVTDDKDLFQLVNAVKVYSPKRAALLDAAAIERILGITPDQVPDFLGLVGDASDNIPGVKGIGPKTAVQLLQRYRHLEDLYEHLSSLPSSVQKKLQNQKDAAFLSRDLATLSEGLDVDVALADLTVGRQDWRRLWEIYQRLEFRSWEKEAAEQFSQEQDDGRDKIEPASRPHEQTARIALWDPSSGRQDEVLFDGVSWIAALDTGQVGVLCKEHPPWEALLYDENVDKIVFDYKTLLHRHRGKPWSWVGRIWDVMLMAYLMEPTRRQPRLEDLAAHYLKQPLGAAATDATKARVLLQLGGVLCDELARLDLTSLYLDLEAPLTRVLYRMEAEGVCVDVEVLHALGRMCQAKITALEQEIFSLAGGPFNPHSPKQLGQVLFERLKLKPLKKTKTGYSTSEEVLKALCAQHKLPALLLEHRQWTKILSTYIEPLVRMVDPNTKRIHASFLQTGTETGRLSCQRPNLQNIPIRSDVGRRVREAFVPRAEDWILLSADYSQIELRLLAHLSGDEALKAAFDRDEDVHTYTAALLYDVPQNEVQPAMRDFAKRINFGIIYGMSPYGLAHDLGLSLDEAQMFIDRYFLRYPKVKVFIEQIIQEAERNGYVTTILNRRRWLSHVAINQAAQRQAVNTVVQGSAADLLKTAMIRLQAMLDETSLQGKMIMTIHDEILFDLPQVELEETASRVKEVMENVFDLTVPLKVSLKAGPNWAQLRSLTCVGAS